MAFMIIHHLNEDVLCRIGDERIISVTIIKWKANWIGQMIMPSKKQCRIIRDKRKYRQLKELKRFKQYWQCLSNIQHWQHWAHKSNTLSILEDYRQPTFRQRGLSIMEKYSQNVANIVPTNSNISRLSILYIYIYAAYMQQYWQYVTNI